MEDKACSPLKQIACALGRGLAGVRLNHSSRRDRRVSRAATYAVEAMERRLLLDATLPSSVALSANATDTITGNPGGYVLTLTAGKATFNADISTAGSDWQNCEIVLATGTQVVFNTRQTLGGFQLDGTATASISSGGGGANGNVMVIGSSGGLSIASGATLDLTDNDMILQNAGERKRCHSPLP